MTGICLIKTGECNDFIDDDITSRYPYDVDHFQRHAINAIRNGANVLVTAHTGSGKTLVGEYAIAYHVNKGHRVIYTSPIKSLSNEKYNEFRRIFPDYSCGLLTGDHKINPEANLLVVTAEILRNSLYGNKHENDSNINADILASVGAVIMDEVHFINDIDRGRVWEETIILLNRNVQLIMLSATISMAETFAKWVAYCKQRDICLIPTNFRVVPLDFNIYINGNMYHIMNTNTKLYDANTVIMASKHHAKLLRDPIIKYPTMGLFDNMITHLQQTDRLQCIFFCFSRNNCEKYAQYVTLTNLIDHDTSRHIQQQITKYMKSYEMYHNTEQYISLTRLMIRGIAYHHSGLMPILRELVELLFRDGYIKVLYATETFAVGVNMPTRSVVFTDYMKYAANRHRYVTPAEFKQMSGRAGRRGKDLIGYVYYMPISADFIDEPAMRSIMTDPAACIHSRFAIDYHFVIKLLQTPSYSLTDFMHISLSEYNDIEAIEQLNHQIAILDDTRDKSHDDKCRDMDNFMNLLNNSNGFAFKLSKQQTATLNKLKQQIPKRVYDDYVNYHNMVEHYDNYMNRNSMIIRQYISFGCDMGYIINNNDNNELTSRGIIVSLINECEPAILAEMISARVFDGMTCIEIITLLAIFVTDLKDSAEWMNIRPECVSVASYRRINDICEHIYDTMKRNNIDATLSYSYQFCQYANTWANGGNVAKCIDPLIGLYEGNFVKNIIKINNIIRDIIVVCKIMKQYDLISVLEPAESLIIRDVAVMNSLYL